MAKSPYAQQTAVADGYYPVTHKHAICWASIFGGAVGAVAISIILFILGSGLGFASVSPWAHKGAGIAGFSIGVGIWLIITQWASAGVGGYITGRLRGRAHNVHTDEVFFRDTAHGFITWSVATIITVLVFTSALTSVISGGAKAATAVTAAGAAGAGHEAARDNDANGYYIDGLLRSDRSSPEDVRGETSRLLAKDVADGKLSDSDQARLTHVVSRQAGISEQEAANRVDNTLAQIEDAKVKAKKAAEDAKQAATYFALFTAISMFVGAFIASVAAAVGGIQRDDYDRRTV